MKIVRFLVGRCITIEGFAMNDFESMSVGDVTTITGGTNNQGCLFNAAIFTIRPQ